MKESDEGVNHPSGACMKESDASSILFFSFLWRSWAILDLNQRPRP